MSDLGSHDNDVPYTVLDIKQALTVEATSPNGAAHGELAPAMMTVVYECPASPSGAPPVKLVWCQGDVKPPGWVPEWGGRSQRFIGDKGMLLGSGALGKPTITVVSMGHPQGLAAVIDNLPAVLTAYCGGPHQGTAIADAIFGVTNPSGKLPVTIPRHVGQVPIHHAQRNGSGYRRNKADIHRGYLDMPSTPLFPFGHGLSYTTFDYSPLKLASNSVDAAGELRASLAIRNTGKRRGTEIVQLYAADTATAVTLPAQQLIGFERVDLEPGQSKTVSFIVPLSVLAYTGASGDLVMEPGPIEVSVGSSSSDIKSTATLNVTGKTRAIRGEDRAFFSAAIVS
jgi:beta-glucosidase